MMVQSKRKNEKQPSDLVSELQPMLKKIEPNAELDFSWQKQAIILCDMRNPSALRYGNLYTVDEIKSGAFSKTGDFERRVKEFMARG